MKNVRVEGDELVYDCEGVGCPTPGEAHRIPIMAVMAALQGTLSDFLVLEDPRAESLDVTMQFLYEKLLASKPDHRPLGADAPWYDALVSMSLPVDDSCDETPKKDWLN